VLTGFNSKVAEEDAMLLGRVTYQEWADYWPTSKTEPFASHINGVPKYVVSRSLDSVPWGTTDNAALLGGDLAEAVTELKGQPGRNIGVHGSPTLVEGLLHADLLDEMRLEIYPVVAGTGARLFKEGNPAKRLRLADSKVTRQWRRHPDLRTGWLTAAKRIPGPSRRVGLVPGYRLTPEANPAGRVWPTSHR